MSAQANAALAHKIYQLFNENKLDAVLALATEDVEIILVPCGQTFHGREGFREFMESFKRAFPDILITDIIHQIATDDAVVNEFKASGAHTGPLMTPVIKLPPTGRTVGFTACEVWEIRDGKLAILRNYQDVAGILRQLGVSV
ncbi:MAG: hypothetical protein DCC55_24110 [Chloroflexi bacterium]|nr:MAG: hypothetical protein DCC55_24110 [Chloroflexota bacterium]